MQALTFTLPHSIAESTSIALRSRSSTGKARTEQEFMLHVSASVRVITFGTLFSVLFITISRTRITVTWFGMTTTVYSSSLIPRTKILTINTLTRSMSTIRRTLSPVRSRQSRSRTTIGQRLTVSGHSAMTHHAPMPVRLR